MRGSFCELPAYAMLSTAPTFMGADDAAGFVTVFIATPSTGRETERATAMLRTGAGWCGEERGDSGCKALLLGGATGRCALER